MGQQFSDGWAPSLVITPFGPQGMCVATGYMGTPTSTAFLGSETVVYYPFRISSPVTILGAFWYNGGTVTGNIDVGIYSCDTVGPDVKLASTGATAQASTNVVQTAALSSSIRLDAGVYYMALLSTSSSSTIFAANNLTVSESSLIGVRQQDSAGTTLPSSATGAAPTSGVIYLFGLYTKRAP